MREHVPLSPVLTRTLSNQHVKGRAITARLKALCSST